MLTSLLAVSLASAQPAVQPDVVFQNYPAIHRVDCDHWRGSAFRVGAGEYLSVAHVTSGEHCKIEGEPVTVTNQDGPNDFAQTHTQIPGLGFQIDCGGFIPGRWYWAIGYAHGADFQTAVAIYATYRKADNGERVFIGTHTVIPGMSGGPVVDSVTGRVVGTVNMYNPLYGLSFSRELKDTAVCQS